MLASNIQYNCDSSNTSIEDQYWALKKLAASKGVTSSQMGQLLKLCQDYKRAYCILNAALKTTYATKYLGKVVSNLKDEFAPVVIKTPRGEPEFVSKARMHNEPVRKDTLDNGQPGWWIGRYLYNKDGIDVGG